jgi:hypothetical protein
MQVYRWVFRSIVTDFRQHRNQRSRCRNGVTHIATERVRSRLLAGVSVPLPRINVRKIKDVLCLKLDAKLSHQQIAEALGISKAPSPNMSAWLQPQAWTGQRYRVTTKWRWDGAW